VSTSVSPNLPGRLGDPDMQLKDDPRADPRMLAAMAPFAIDVMPPPTPVTADWSLEAIHEHITASEDGFGQLFAAYFTDRTPTPRAIPTSRRWSRTTDTSCRRT
jgi:acetyl esterase